MSDQSRAGSRRNGGAAVVDALIRNDVTTVFGIPGTHNLEIYRHLTGSGIRHVTPRHEQGAGYAADGYARVSGRPAVVITTSGPGLTNAVTAAATAYADSIPMLLISPGIPRGFVGADIGWLHEMKDQSAHLAAAVHRSVRVNDANEIGAVIDEAFDEWSRSRPRPIHLEIPVDVLEELWEGGTGKSTSAPVASKVADQRFFAEAGALLAASRRPAILVGGGAVSASQHVTALAEMLGAPVVTTVNGKGVVPESHALSLGASIRLVAAQQFLEDSDVLIIAGSEVGDSDLWGRRLTPTGVVIRIDIDAAQLDKNVKSALAIHADCEQALKALISNLEEATLELQDASWAARTVVARTAISAEASHSGDRWAPIQQIMSESLPADTIVAGDSSQVSYYGTVHYWPMSQPRQFLYPTGYATLGYGLPAAIGAKIADPSRTVVALVGDGAFQFSAMEIVTAVQNRLCLPVVVVNNGGYREIKDQQIERGIAPIAVDLLTPNFAELAMACGGRGSVVRDLHDLPERLEEALRFDGPTVIEIRFD